jgi:hypothetical protein
LRQDGTPDFENTGGLASLTRLPIHLEPAEFQRENVTPVPICIKDGPRGTYQYLVRHAMRTRVAPDVSVWRMYDLPDYAGSELEIVQLFQPPGERIIRVFPESKKRT